MPVRLPLHLVSNGDENLFQIIGLFADRDHFNDIHWELVALTERLRERATGRDLIGRRPNRFAQDAIAGGVLRDSQRVQNGNAVVKQRAEDAAEPRDGETADDATDSKQIETELIEPPLPRVVREILLCGDEGARQRNEAQPAVLLHEAAHGEQCRRGPRQRPVLAHLFKQRLELRYEEDQHRD